MPYAFLSQFAQMYATERPEGLVLEEEVVVDLENPRPSRGAELPCAYAIEFLADVYEAAGGDEKSKAVSVRACLHSNTSATELRSVVVQVTCR